MSLDKDMDVVKLISKYQKRFPEAPRAEIHTLVRLEYEKYCAKHGILGTHEKVAFLRKLDRELGRMFPGVKKIQSGKSAIETTKSERYSDYSKKLDEISLGIVSNPDLAPQELLAFLPSLPVEIRNRARIQLGINEIFEKDKPRLLSETISNIQDMLDELKKK